MPRWMVGLAGVVCAAVVGSVMLGLSYPDGHVDRPVSTASPSTTSSPQTASPEPQIPPGTLAPESVHGVWPGRPDSTTEVDGTVDWCPAVKVDVSAYARQVAGSRVNHVACEAVRYMLDGRYTRLALPRRTYAAKDFDYLKDFVDPAVFRQHIKPWITRFVRNPRGTKVADLSIFLGTGTPPKAPHASAIDGRVFYGPAFSDKGYEDRAVWINPTWSRVRVTGVGSQLDVALSASASLPVFNPTTDDDDMIVVKASAHLRYAKVDNGRWLIVSGKVQTAKPVVKPLKVDESSQEN